MIKIETNFNEMSRTADYRDYGYYKPDGMIMAALEHTKLPQMNLGLCSTPTRTEWMEFIILSLIEKAKYNALKTVNSELINLYWNVGEYINNKVEKEEWGTSTVDKLAEYLQKVKPGLKGFERRNLFRMKQFYEIYKENEKMSPLVTQISWTNNLMIINKAKTAEEREFYLMLCIKEKYSKRELERQINSCFYERTMLSKQKVSAVIKQNEKPAPLVRELTNNFKDSYILDFLDLPESFSEKDFRKSILLNFKKFILEFGKDFTLVGEEYKIQAGNSDYFIDLLFFHRSLRCLVVFELKIDEFKPEYLGKMNFYLNVLDETMKKEYENPSVGVILCKDKNDEIVRLSLNRNLSPALIAEYKTELDNKILGKKFKELVEIFEDNN